MPQNYNNMIDEMDFLGELHVGEAAGPVDNAGEDPMLPEPEEHPQANIYADAVMVQNPPPQDDNYADIPVNPAPGVFYNPWEHKPVSRRIDGLLVIYIQVGELKPQKAFEVLEVVKQEYGDIIKNLKDTNIEVMWLPVRQGETR